jgi:hypothetical protein
MLRRVVDFVVPVECIPANSRFKFARMKAVASTALSAGKPRPVLVSICGFKDAILVGAVIALSRPVIGPRRSMLLALIGIAVYTVLVGVGASVLQRWLASAQALPRRSGAARSHLRQMCQSLWIFVSSG